MTFTVYNNEGTALLATTSYLAARRCWATYLSDNPKPTGQAGIDAKSKAGDSKVDTHYLDRVCGYGTASEREPTQVEVTNALFF